MSEVPIVFTVFGEPASKSNQRRLVTIGGMARMIKSKKALSYLEDFMSQCPDLGPEMFEGPVEVTMDIWYASRRPDIDGGASLVLDAMQKRIYVNDRQVVKLNVVKHEPDKHNPRVLIRVEACERA